MTETRLRELHRLAVGGDADAEERLLRERLRVGSVTTEGLMLLAHMGHPPACAVLGVEPTPRRRSVREWLRRLQPHAPLEVFNRVSIAAARKVFPIWRRAHPGYRWGSAGALRSEQEPRLAIEAAEAFAVCLCPEHAEAVERRLRREHRDHGEASRQERVALLACSRSVGVAARVAILTGHLRNRVFARSEEQHLQASTQALLSSARDALRSRGSVSRWRANRLLLAAIRDEVVPWLLGQRDPVRMRVAKRGEVELGEIPDED